MRNQRAHKTIDRRLKVEGRAFVRVFAFIVLALILTHTQGLHSSAQTRRKTTQKKSQANGAALSDTDAAAQLARAVELLQAGKLVEAEPLVRGVVAAQPSNA